MDRNAAIDYRNPNIIRKMGIDALTKELGPVGMAYFIQQYDRGEGDYTAEREDLLADLTAENLLMDLDTMRRQRQNF
ncbi:MAG: hypothetical protein LBH39_02410 [Clostridiales Family XIII bacterium]|jgi:hypothetical protein|nr:hypothetical protein [Clostridiales Family XIII bacterium]